MCREPALLTTHLARMVSLNWRPPDVAVVSADTPTAWRLCWPVPVLFTMRILSAYVPTHTSLHVSLTSHESLSCLQQIHSILKSPP